MNEKKYAVEPQNLWEKVYAVIIISFGSVVIWEEVAYVK